MDFFSKLSYKIGDNLVRSNVIEEEDAEIYIYGINQILVSILNISSALIIGWIFGVLLEMVVFMAAYIPLRSFAGGYHAKTPLRCYIFSVIMLILVSVLIKYQFMSDAVCYAIFAGAVLIIFIFSPIEDKNKPLDKIEQKIYKERVFMIGIAELVICLVLRLINFNNLFIAITYSFVMLSIMIIIGKIKNILTLIKIINMK